MFLIPYAIVASFTSIMGFLAWKYESIRTFKDIDKYMFSLSISIFSFLINSIIINLKFPKKFTFPVIFIFNILLIATVSYIYKNFAKIVESVSGETLNFNDLKDLKKEISDNFKDKQTFLSISSYALTISISFLMLKNVMFANYILISFYFFIYIKILFQDVDKITKNLIEHLIQTKSITLYDSKRNLDKIAESLCEKWKTIYKDDLIKKIVDTVDSTSINTLDTTFFVRIITESQLSSMLQFINDSCDIILHKNSNTTIILAFRVKNFNDLINVYAQNYDKYKKSLQSTYLIQSNDNSTEYNYETETTKPVVSLLQKFLLKPKNKNISTFWYI